MAYSINPGYPLRSIILTPFCERSLLDDAQTVLGPVFHLQIIHQLMCTGGVPSYGSQYPPDVVRLLYVVEKVSLVRLQVSVEVEQERMRFAPWVLWIMTISRFCAAALAHPSGCTKDSLSHVSI